MTELPFADATFDHVLAWNVIYHGDETILRRTLHEVRRVLRGDTVQYIDLAGLGQDERRRRLETSISRLAALQADSGHFSMWGGSDTSPILTPAIAEFLLAARDAGFAVPEAMLQKTLERLNEDLLSGGLPFYAYDQSDHLRFAYQAQAGLVLASLNRAPLGTLRALHDNQRKNSLTGLPLVQLGLALSLQGDAVRGDAAIREGLAKASRRPRWLGDYGSETSDQALVLALLREHDRDTDGQDERLLALSRDLQARGSGSPAWYSTREQIALARLGRQLALDGDRTFAGTLLTLAIVEHWFMVLPLRFERLWQWSLRGRAVA